MNPSIPSGNLFAGDEPDGTSTRPIDFLPADDDALTVEEIRRLLKLPEGNSIGIYEELHTIGIGGFGAVYGAREPGLERRLALKILRPNFRNRPERVKAFIREARITARIAHPNIVPVHRIGVFEDAGVYFSMKRIEGETLKAILHKMEEDLPGYRERFTLSRLVDIFIGACQGVFYAHQNGILHCDLKPGNIMVGDFGEVLVMDWGMARYVPAADCVGDNRPGGGEDVGEQETGAPLGGTPVFMAPEHLSLNSSEPTVRSDIYALGCVLYSILTWRIAPFDTEGTLEEIQHRVVQGKLIPPRRIAPPGREVPRELEAICLKAMARMPEKRYADAGELLEDLRRYRDGLPVNAYSPSLIYKAGKFIFRRPLVPTVFILALLVWFGFFLYTSFNELIAVESLRTSAGNYFRSGEKILMRARRRFDRIRRGMGNAADLRNQERVIQAEAMEAESDFRAAMNSLARIPEKYRDSRMVFLTAGSMFRALYSFFALVGDNERLRQMARNCMDRWPAVFKAARRTDPDLERMFRQALSGKGWLVIVTDRGIDWDVVDSRGKKVSLLPLMSSRGGGTLRECWLPVGLYAVIGRARNVEKRVPVRVSLSGRSRADVTRIYRPPEGMVLIPGGEFRHEPEISNSYSRFSFERDFFIKRTEVTVGEYLEFWKSLKDPEMKERCASYYFSTPDSLRSARSWDDRGRLLRPGLTAAHPVTGIPAMAAEAYCAFLSKKLKRRVVLPTRSQWSKAAGGIDGLEYAWGDTFKEGRAVLNAADARPVGTSPGDVSIYGVMDMTGNVREFVKAVSASKGRTVRYAAAGGAYDSSPDAARLSTIVYSSRGGNDVGFRYVMFPDERERVPGAGK